MFLGTSAIAAYYRIMAALGLRGFTGFTGPKNAAQPAGPYYSIFERRNSGSCQENAIKQRSRAAFRFLEI
jgi:hypothetical protein